MKVYVLTLVNAETDKIIAVIDVFSTRKAAIKSAKDTGWEKKDYTVEAYKVLGEK